MDITNKSYSIRFSIEDAQGVADFVSDYQAKHGQTFENMKQLFLHMKDQLQNEAPSPQEIGEHILVSDIKDEALSYAERNNLPVESTAIQIVKDALTSEKIETVEVEKEVLKDRELSETELLLDLDEEQLQCLNSINANRNKELEKIEGAGSEEIEDTAKGLMFNEATLNDWSGSFYTGI